MTDLKLYESEYRFMDLIWEAEPVRSTELRKWPESGWSGKNPPAIRF